MNCEYCKTGICELVGEINSPNFLNNAALTLTNRKTEQAYFRIYICSNPRCNHVSFIANDDTLYKLRKKLREQDLQMAEGY